MGILLCDMDTNQLLLVDLTLTAAICLGCLVAVKQSSPQGADIHII